MNQLNILPTLRSQPADFYIRMQTYVYPGLEGTDHDRLLYYYTLLEGCDAEETGNAEMHLRLMKKIKVSAPGVTLKLMFLCSRRALGCGTVYLTLGVSRPTCLI